MQMRAKIAAAAAVAVAAGLLAVGTPAGAVAAPAPLTASQFGMLATYHQYDALNTALAGTLGTAAVHTVMDNANHDRTGITDSLGLAGYTGGFRFDSGDNADCANVPQGITTSRDAVGGNYDGHQLVVVSWYTKADCASKGQARSRITLVDWDATYPDKYRKVLLVEPTGTTAAPSFTDIPVHAGGVVWYGDYLYVADTGRGMRIFDMRRILKTSTAGTADQIGRQANGAYYAHNYAYVLPQVGLTASGGPASIPLSWSSISLDRARPSIVMTEYTCAGCADYDNRPPRVVRFPFAAGSTTFAAGTVASEAWQLPWYNLNGVASHNGRWWVNSSAAKTLYYWAPDGSLSAHPWVSGGESLSYWEDPGSADLLWSLQETAGHRNVFAVKQASYT